MTRIVKMTIEAKAPHEGQLVPVSISAEIPVSENIADDVAASEAYDTVLRLHHSDVPWDWEDTAVIAEVVNLGV